MIQPHIHGYMAVTQWSNTLYKAIWQSHNDPTPYTRLYGSHTMVQPPIQSKLYGSNTMIQPNIQGYMAVAQWSNPLYKAKWQ